MRIGQKIILKEELSSSNNLREEDDIKEKLSNEETEQIQKTIVVDGTMTHIVVKGDTLYNICKRYSVTIEQLKQWNNIENITIQIGQKLIVSP
jgi:LysM repeat protein